MVQKRRIGPRTVDRAGLDHALGDRLQSGEKEQEIVGDLIPGRGDHHQAHRVCAVQQRIPVEFLWRNGRAIMPRPGWNMKIHSTPATAGATAYGHDHEGL